MTAHISLTRAARALAERSIRLYRLALASDDVRDLQSPHHRPTHVDSIPRPTEDAATCPYRAHVAETADRVARHLPALTRELDDALAAWEAPPAP